MALDFRNDSMNFILAAILVSCVAAWPDAPIKWLNQVGAIIISLIILKTWIGELLFF